jgi:transposase
MSRKEVPRAGLIRAALAGKITNTEGAAALNLSVRQFQRLKSRFRRGGEKALVHQSRGRPSGRGLKPSVRCRVARLMSTTYSGFNDLHLTEKLREVEGIAIGRESVRRLRRSLGLAAKRRRRPRRHRSRRLREARQGALVQIDASPHEWLEKRGPALSLHGAVDDADGTVLALTFRPTEDLHGYATILSQLFHTYGLPVAFYGDGTPVMVRLDDHWTIEEELAGEQTPTHLGRVLRDLGIRYIRARSPQAKGRVENRWSTLQDRLISELRLRGINTLEAANAFLPEFRADFNKRFARAPREAQPVWRRPPRDLDQLLGCRYLRVVAGDNTVKLAGRWIQIPPGPGGRSYAGCRVEARELIDGRLLTFHQGRGIASQPSPGHSFELKPRGSYFGSHKARGLKALAAPEPAPSRKVQPKTRGSCIPGPTHPWRKSTLPHVRNSQRKGVTLSRGS